MIRTQLHTGWNLSFTGGPVPGTMPPSIAATVPGTVHTDLLANGLIADPYLDLNEHDLQWIGHSSVRYDLDFDFARGDHERVDLVCEGLDTVASLTLNGQPLGETRNQHRSYRFDLRESLHESVRESLHEIPSGHGGQNRLAIDFASALDYATAAEKRLGERPFVGNAHPYNAIRKMACNFGWDWGPVLITAGIWKPISIEAWSTARIASVRPVVSISDSTGAVPTGAVPTGTVPTGAVPTGSVQLSLELEKTGTAAVEARVRLLDPLGVEVSATTVTIAGESADIHLDAGEVRLWWPRGYGDQPLYTIETTISADGAVLDRSTKTIGFRSVSLDLTPDDIGTGFTFSINGQYVYIKGANWIPDDCFLPRITPERYASSIRDATEAGFNLLRVWGGGIYESDDFYDECDREGVLVWQDFTLACAAYSEHAELWQEIEAEARQNVVRLAPHPSLIVWNGGNENVEGYYHWGWKEALAEGEAWGNGYYETLFPAILAELDPTRAYLPSSPYNPADASDPRNPDNGPVHEWEVWNRQDYSTYRQNIPRFVAEFGFQGPPAYSTLARSIHDDPFTPTSPGIVSHQKADDGNGKLDRGLGTHLPAPTSFDNWHFATQLNQARAISYGIEHFRSHSPRTAGSIVWQLNDCWPVLSWAAVDGDKRRKPLWYALRSVNAERLLTIQPRDGGLALIVSNDSSSHWADTIVVARRALDGSTLAEQSITVAVEARSTLTVLIGADVAVPGDPASELLVATSTLGEPAAQPRRALWYFVEDTQLALPARHIVSAVTKIPTGYAVELTATAFVKDLVLAVDRLDPAATVDELFVTLLPGESTSIAVRTDATIDPAALVRYPVLNSVNDLLCNSRANKLTSP